MEAKSENDINKPQLRGSCLCGASKYSVTGSPIQAVICHCRNCKKWGGGAFAANVWIPKDHFNVDDASASNITRYKDSNTDAGGTLYRAFCKECGSAVFVDIPHYDIVSVTRGTLDVAEDVETLNPAVEFYCSRRLPWAEISSKTEKKRTLE
jgi:hypothetical protein